MGEEIPASLTIYLPKGGVPRKHAKHVPQLLADLGDCGDAASDTLVQSVLKEGGKIFLESGTASYGEICGVNVGGGALPTWAKAFDFDYHSDAKYEFDAVQAYNRGGKCTQLGSDQETGSVNCGLARLEEALQAGKSLAEVVAGLRYPPVTYPTGGLEATILFD